MCSDMGILRPFTTSDSACAGYRSQLFAYLRIAARAGGSGTGTDGSLYRQCSAGIGSMARTKECAVPGDLDAEPAGDWRDLLDCSMWYEYVRYCCRDHRRDGCANRSDPRPGSDDCYKKRVSVEGDMAE